MILIHYGDDTSHINRNSRDGEEFVFGGNIYMQGQKAMNFTLHSFAPPFYVVVSLFSGRRRENDFHQSDVFPLVGDGLLLKVEFPHADLLS